MAKSKPLKVLGNVARAALPFVPGLGQYAAVADALGVFGSPGGGGGGGGGGGARLPFDISPFVQAAQSRLPMQGRLLDLAEQQISGLTERAAGIDDEALLEEFLQDSMSRLLPRAIEAGLSGPLAGLVRRGIGVNSSLAGDITSRITSDVTADLLTEAMKRRLSFPDLGLQRSLQVANAVMGLASGVDPTQSIAALLSPSASLALGNAQLAAGSRSDKARGLAELMKGFDPKKEFQNFADLFRKRSRNQQQSADSTGFFSPMVIPRV